jgi:hypothetical protein
MRCLVQLGSLDFADGSTWQQAGDDLQALLLLSAMTWFEAAREGEAAMPVTTDVGFIEMRIAKAVGFGPLSAEERFHCVMLDEISADRHVVISIGTGAIHAGRERATLPYLSQTLAVIPLAFPGPSLSLRPCRRQNPHDPG